MAPTEILARQHYTLAKKLFPKNIILNYFQVKVKILKKKELLKN